MDYIYSLDIGSEQDFCAGALIRRHTRYQTRADVLPDATATARRTMIVERHLLHTYRPPLRTPYHQVVRRVGEIINHADLRQNCYLVVDKGQVGGAIVQTMIRSGMYPYAVNITGGKSVSSNERGWNVPKSDIVGSLVLGLEQQIVRVHPSIDDRDALVEELKKFRMKRRKSGHLSFEAERDRDHDDLVMSLAMGVWFSDRVWSEHGLEANSSVVTFEDGSIMFERQNRREHDSYGP